MFVMCAPGNFVDHENWGAFVEYLELAALGFTNQEDKSSVARGLLAKIRELGMTRPQPLTGEATGEPPAARDPVAATEDLMWQVDL